jgi:hypothetical protein
MNKLNAKQKLQGYKDYIRELTVRRKEKTSHLSHSEISNFRM